MTATLWLCFSFLDSAFCPYHIGHFSVVGLGFEEYVRSWTFFHYCKFFPVAWWFICWAPMLCFSSGTGLPFWGLDHNHSGLYPVGHDSYPVSRILKSTTTSPLHPWQTFCFVSVCLGCEHCWSLTAISGIGRSGQVPALPAAPGSLLYCCEGNPIKPMPCCTGKYGHFI